MALGGEFGLEGGWHLCGGGSGDAESDFDEIVDEPLGGGEGTDHDDPGAETLPESGKSEFLGDVHRRSCLFLVQLGNYGVSGMRDDGAENTGNVTGGERDDELFTFAALISGLGHNMSVQELDGLFKTGKFHHGVGDLPHPQGDERLEESVHPFFLHHLGDSFPEGVGEPGGGLDFDFDGFHRRQSDVGEEFGRR